MKLGIMGGTFDPVHFGHIFIAEEVRRELKLDEIWFIPSGNPAHKRGKEVAPAEKRYQMLQAAIASYPQFSISDIEMKRDGYTYTIDTLQELHRILPPDTLLHYIVGADVVAELDTWKAYQEDFKLCSFVAVRRPGYNQTLFQNSVEKMRGLGARILVVQTTQRNISSSEIRSKVRNGQSISALVPPAVETIIQQERLYYDG